MALPFDKNLKNLRELSYESKQNKPRVQVNTIYQKYVGEFNLIFLVKTELLISLTNNWLVSISKLSFPSKISTQILQHIFDIPIVFQNLGVSQSQSSRLSALEAAYYQEIEVMQRELKIGMLTEGKPNFETQSV